MPGDAEPADERAPAVGASGGRVGFVPAADARARPDRGGRSRPRGGVRGHPGERGVRRVRGLRQCGRPSCPPGRALRRGAERRRDAGRERSGPAPRDPAAGPRHARGAGDGKPDRGDGGPGAGDGRPALPGQAGLGRRARALRRPRRASSGSSRWSSARRCAPRATRPAHGRSLRARGRLRARARLALHGLPAHRADARRLGVRLGGPPADARAGGRGPPRVPRDGRAPGPHPGPRPGDPRAASAGRPSARRA